MTTRILGIVVVLACSVTGTAEASVLTPECATTPPPPTVHNGGRVECHLHAAAAAEGRDGVFRRIASPI